MLKHITRAYETYSFSMQASIQNINSLKTFNMIVFATLHSIEFKYAEIIFFKFSYLWERYKQNLQLLLLLYQKIWKQT